MKPKLLFIATKQPDYSRIKLIRSSLESAYEVDCILSNARSYPVRVVEVCWRFLWMRKSAYDVVVLGFFAQLIFPFIRLVWRGKLVSDCFISLYDSLICDRARFKEGGVVAKFARWLDAVMLRHSDLSLTDTKAHAQYLMDTYSLNASTVVPIAVSADENVFKFTPASAEDYQVGSHFRVFFYGAYIPLQGTEVIVRAAKLLEGKAFEIHMLGKGQTYEATTALAQELGVTNVVFHGLQTLERLAEMSCESHLLLGIFGTTEKAQRVIPNKVFEAVCLGRPVITGDSQTVRDYFADGSSILLVPFGDPQALADKILWVQTHYEEAVTIGSNGRQVYDSGLSLEHVQAQLIEAIRSLSAEDREV